MKEKGGTQATVSKKGKKGREAPRGRTPEGFLLVPARGEKRGDDVCVTRGGKKKAAPSAVKTTPTTTLAKERRRPLLPRLRKKKKNTVPANDTRGVLRTSSTGQKG